MSSPMQAGAADPDAPLYPREKRLVGGIGVALFAAVLLQKVWLPPIEAPFFVTLLLLAWLLLERYAKLSLLRGTTYAAVTAAILGLQLFGPRDLAPSYVGLIFFVGLYAPFMFEVSLRRPVYMEIMDVFVRLSALVGALVIVDWLIQTSGRPMPSIETIIPASLRFPGYNYIQSLVYGSHFNKPNAFFMLETSHTSQLLAMGLIAEIVAKQRLWMIAFLISTQLLSFGGTGLLLLLLCTPLLLLKLRPRLILAALVAAPLLFIGAYQVGLVKNFTSRSGEFTQDKSSGNARFVEPYRIMAEIVSADDATALFGIGAGNVKSDWRTRDTSYLTVLNPLTKLVIEFGLIVALLWMIWFHIVVLRSGAPLLVSLAVLIQFDFLNGSLLVPVNVAYCWLMSGMYAVDRRNRLATPSKRAQG